MKYLKEFDITNNQNIISDILDDADLDFKFNKSRNTHIGFKTQEQYSSQMQF